MGEEGYNSVLGAEMPEKGYLWLLESGGCSEPGWGGSFGASRVGSRWSCSCRVPAVGRACRRCYAVVWGPGDICGDV